MTFLAYLDPGSASALLAAVLAGIAGIGAALRTYGKNFFNKLMFWKKSEPDETNSADDDTPHGDATEGDASHGDDDPKAAASPDEAASAEPVETPATQSDADRSPGQ